MEIIVRKTWTSDGTGNGAVPHYPFTITNYPVPTENCLHRSCDLCNGTGIKKDGSGFCIHMIS